MFNLLQEHVHLFGGILSGQAKIAFEFEVFSLSYCSLVFFFFSFELLIELSGNYV